MVVCLCIFSWFLLQRLCYAESIIFTEFVFIFVWLNITNSSGIFPRLLDFKVFSICHYFASIVYTNSRMSRLGCDFLWQFYACIYQLVHGFMCYSVSSSKPSVLDDKDRSVLALVHVNHLKLCISLFLLFLWFSVERCNLHCRVQLLS